MFGLGLRGKHYAEILRDGVRGADFVECITENFATRGGRPRAVLERVRRDVPVCFHGVSMSIGGVAPIDWDYLRHVRDLAREIEPLWVSDHLCFSTDEVGHHAHDLWPLPRTEETLGRVVARTAQVQEFLGRQIVLENVSSYVEYAADQMAEAAFVAEVANRADCLLLLDVNNIVVNAHNHGFSEESYLAAIPTHRIAQVHLAGHTDYGRYLFDSHVGPVPDRVWSLYRSLYRSLVRRRVSAPAIIEWDQEVPALPVLLSEVDAARAMARACRSEAA